MGQSKFIFGRDYLRFKGKEDNYFLKFFNTLFSSALLYIYTGRKKSNASNGISRLLWGNINKLIGRVHGNEIDFSCIDAGLVLGHPYSITVAKGSIIGSDVTLFKGCTIGAVRSGHLEGCPQIGERVVVCCNAMVCGNIHVGNDVLIAANAFVNFNVPDNSIVIGNPGTIHYKKMAATDYL